MKIVRLVSDQIPSGQTSLSYFTKACSAPIIAKPFSKIALKSISYELPNIPSSGDDLIIVLENLGIEGYDFLTNQKSSIVAIIPFDSLILNGSSFSYIEPFPTFVSLNNATPMNINNFYVSIKQGANFISVIDRIYIQLLIDG